MAAMDPRDEPGADGGRDLADAPFYLPSGNEISVFAECHARGLAVMLKGPTGCGKTRLVEHMAWRLRRPLITVSCHDDLTPGDLVGQIGRAHAWTPVTWK